MNTLPDSPNKHVRQVAREWTSLWGATWEGDTSDGHHVFRFPGGTESTISHTPSAGHSWVKARRHEASKITGQPFRGKRDPRKAKAKAARQRRTEGRYLDRSAWTREFARQRQNAEHEHRNRQLVAVNLDTIRSIRSRLGDLTTVRERRYAEQAIATLRDENIALGWQPSSCQAVRG